MILRPYGQSFVGGIHGRAFGYGPRHQHAVDRQPEIVVQASGSVLLNDKDTPAASAPDAPRWLRCLSEFPLPLVLFEWHSVPEVSFAPWPAKLRATKNLSRDPRSLPAGR